MFESLPAPVGQILTTRSLPPVQGHIAFHSATVTMQRARANGNRTEGREYSDKWPKGPGILSGFLKRCSPSCIIDCVPLHTTAYRTDNTGADETCVVVETVHCDKRLLMSPSSWLNSLVIAAITTVRIEASEDRSLDLFGVSVFRKSNSA